MIKTKETVIIAYCDLCKKNLPIIDDYAPHMEVKIIGGYYDPIDYFGDKTSWDLCEDCYNKHVKPLRDLLLKAQP